MAPKITDEELIREFLDDCDLRDMTQKTIENYRSAVRIFTEFIHHRNQVLVSLDGMESKEILESFTRYLIKERHVSYSRIKIYFSALNSLYDHLEYQGYIKKNIVLSVRRHYVRKNKKNYQSATRKILEIEEMSAFLNGIMNLRDKTIAVVFVKTGIRRGELISLDLGDIDFAEKTIHLKPLFHKRSNKEVFFDDECGYILQQWLKRRAHLAHDDEVALFVSDSGNRLGRQGVYDAIKRWSIRMGHYNKASKRLEDRFTCHNLRHCYTTYLRRNGMPREYIKQLRGDARKEAIDIYDHVDSKDVKKVYLACMPKFNVY
jgi:integrase/recombinase XerD